MEGSLGVPAVWRLVVDAACPSILIATSQLRSFGPAIVTLELCPVTLDSWAGRGRLFRLGWIRFGRLISFGFTSFSFLGRFACFLFFIFGWFSGIIICNKFERRPHKLLAELVTSNAVGVEPGL